MSEIKKFMFSNFNFNPNPTQNMNNNLHAMNLNLLPSINRATKQVEKVNNQLQKTKTRPKIESLRERPTSNIEWKSNNIHQVKIVQRNIYSSNLNKQERIENEAKSKLVLNPTQNNNLKAIEKKDSNISSYRIPLNSFKKKVTKIEINSSFEPKDKIEEKQNLKLAKIYKDLNFIEEPNLNHRNTMEDYVKIYENFMGDISKCLLTLYDGHGGKEVAIFAKDHFSEIFAEFIHKSSTTIEKSLEGAFKKIDEKIKNKKFPDTVGSTALICYLTIEKSKRVLYVANVGDSRAVLVSKQNVKKISYDHLCQDENEEARVKSNGGIIFRGRVYGTLALTRALGDFSLKNYGVISTPSVSKLNISDTDLFLIMASDGIWDVITDEKILQFVNLEKDLTSQKLNELIVKSAIELDSRDNISCIVVHLN